MEESNILTVSGGDSLTVSGGDSAGYDLYYKAVYNAVSDAIEARQTVTDGQSVSSTALTYFEGILGNQKLPVDYVIYVGEPYYYDYGDYQRMAYEYCMAYGDLSLEGNYFTGEGTLVTMRTSGAVSVEYAEDQAISLVAPLYYSRSNLGNYSGVIRYDYTGLCLLLFVMIGGVVWYMRKIFGFWF